MTTKKHGIALRLLFGSLVLIGLAVAPAPALAQAEDAGGAVTFTATTAPAPDPTPAAAPTNSPTTATAVITPAAPAPVVVTPQVAQTGLEKLSDQLLAILVPSFVLFIGGLATLGLNKMKKKLGIEVSDQQTEQWRTLARDAALRGAEWARKKAKEATDGKKVPGPAVLDVAVNWATDMAVWQKLPDLARSKLEGLIEVELFKLRQEDEDATRATIAANPGSMEIDISKLTRV